MGIFLGNLIVMVVGLVCLIEFFKVGNEEKLVEKIKMLVEGLKVLVVKYNVLFVV